MLTLTQAIKTGKLQEFTEQEEARGMGPIDRAEFESLSTALIKARQSTGRTSRSSSGDGSSGKKTPQDTGPDASG